MKTIFWTRAGVFFAALLLVASMTRGQAALDMAGAEAEAAGWKLRFGDDFNRTLLGDRWQTVLGKWSLRNGMLCSDGRAYIVSSWYFTGDVRLEYEAVTDAKKPSDLSAVLCRDVTREASGYYFGFGGDDNRNSFLTIRDERVKFSDTRIEPGKRHKVVCQREGANISFSVDGKVIISYVDDRPVTKSRFGLSVWSPSRFDEVRIYTKNDGEAIPPAPRAAVQVQTFEVTGFEIPDPLFEPLLGDRSTPGVFPPYATKYDGRSDRRGAISIEQHRFAAKRFGGRFVADEQLDEAAEYGLIPFGPRDDPAYRKRGLVTRRSVVDFPRAKPTISLPDQNLPAVHGGGGWIMDPRYLKELSRQIEQRAREDRHDYVLHFDEIWTHYVIKPIPRDHWYEQVFEADRQIRQQYGFGKYGMPTSFAEGDPFDRIAYARWAWDRLTESFVNGYDAAKKINSNMKIVGPTHGSTATSGDIEAWSKGLDIYGGQTVGAQTNTLFDWVRPGCTTKLYVDLSGIPTWMMVHMAKRQMPVRDAEYIREVYSQVFRNGGENVWLMPREFFEREIEDAMFAEPYKWHANLELSKVIRRMKLPRMPAVADTAILFSAITTVTDQWGGLSGDNDRHISAYAALGPCLRNWFHFVSDRQIYRGTRDLAAYKTVFVPWATYEHPDVLERFKAYARDGGTLVFTDHDAFTWNINGERFGKAWEQLAGVRRVGPRTGAAIMTTRASEHLDLPDGFTLGALVPGVEVEPIHDRVVTIATFPDGSPAITMHPYGKGKVYCFAADPLYARYEPPHKSSTVAEGSPVVRFFEAIQNAAGVKAGHDIWRFKLPPYRTDIFRRESGLCLTNNYVYDVNEPLLEPNNRDLGGSYSYSRAPDVMEDVAVTAVPFNTGHLTNRLAAFETREKRKSSTLAYIESQTPNWVVSWKDPAPVSVTFDLNSDQPLTQCRLVFSGAMPALMVQGSRDGKTWIRLASTFETVAAMDVKDVRLYLDDAYRSGKGITGLMRPDSYRYVRFDFASRQAGDSFELCEVEIWGKLPRQ